MYLYTGCLVNFYCNCSVNTGSSKKQQTLTKSKKKCSKTKSGDRKEILIFQGNNYWTHCTLKLYCVCIKLCNLDWNNVMARICMFVLMQTSIISETMAWKTVWQILYNKHLFAFICKYVVFCDFFKWIYSVFSMIVLYLDYVKDATLPLNKMDSFFFFSKTITKVNRW